MAPLAAALLAASLLTGAAGSSPSQPLEWAGDPSRAAAPQVREMVPEVRELAPDVREAVPTVEALVVEQAQETEVVLGTDVLFGFDSAELPADAQTQLAGVVAEIEARGPATVRVEGHTDGLGGDDYNQGLSEQRAAAVAAALSGLVGPGPAFEQVGLGSTQPLAPEVTPEGEDDAAARARNRRVSITLVQGQ